MSSNGDLSKHNRLGKDPSQEVKYEDIEKVSSHIEQEARIILPGIQALFGFQLIVVFNTGFKSDLIHSEKLIHLLAITLTVLSIALILTPAAYHRQREPLQVSRHFVIMATRFLTSAMFSLMLAICLDFYLIGKVITGSEFVSTASALIALTVFLYLWFIFPRINKSGKS